jgi:4-amino-4-deoxy-L-arabinose transferase-like glycosyltransferase
MCAIQVIWLFAVWKAGITTAGSTPLSLAGVAATLFAGAILVPELSWSRITSTIQQRQPPTAVLLAAIVGCVAVAGTVYARAQPPLPDEDSALAAARILAAQGPVRFFAQYAEIAWLGIQHPPLVPLLFGLFVKTFGDTLIVPRLVSLLFLLATVPVTYQLGRRLYGRATGLLAALSLVLIPYMFRVGVAARTDMAVTFFASVALLCVVRLVDRPDWKWIAGTGISIGLAVLCKYSAFLILPVLPLLLLWQRASRTAWIGLVTAFFVAAVVVSPWLLFAYQSGVFVAQARTILLYLGGPALDEGAVHHHGAVRYQLELLLTSLPSGIGVHNLPLILTGVWLLARRRQEPDVTILIWIAAIAALLLVLLPDPRYFMLTFPALAILIARTLRGVGRGVEPIIALGLLYCGEAVYLYTAAARTAFLFGR